MHPLREELNGFVEGRQAAEAIIAHINACEFCSLYCERYRLLLSSIDAAETTGQSDLTEVAMRIFTTSAPAKIIHLSPLEPERPRQQQLLAADGKREEGSELQNLATWISQEQDIVVRVMRDSLHKLDYLQVIAPDQSRMSHVLIESIDSNHAFVTDGHGKVELGLREIEEIASIKWQIKLPEALFQLHSLSYDPERVENESDTVLTSPGGDRVSIKLLKKTEGKEIVIRVLSLDGNDQYQSARVAITSRSGTKVMGIRPNDSLKFAIIDPATEIDIRIFE